MEESAVWLLMLKKRNTSVHLYNEEEIDALMILIRDSFIPAFAGLERVLEQKLEEMEGDWKGGL